MLDVGRIARGVEFVAHGKLSALSNERSTKRCFRCGGGILTRVRREPATGSTPPSRGRVARVREEPGATTLLVLRDPADWSDATTWTKSGFCHARVTSVPVSRPSSHRDQGSCRVASSTCVWSVFAPKPRPQNHCSRAAAYCRCRRGSSRRFRPGPLEHPDSSPRRSSATRLPRGRTHNPESLRRPSMDATLAADHRLGVEVDVRLRGHQVPVLRLLVGSHSCLALRTSAVAIPDRLLFEGLVAWSRPRDTAVICYGKPTVSTGPTQRLGPSFGRF